MAFYSTPKKSEVIHEHSICENGGWRMLPGSSKWKRFPLCVRPCLVCHLLPCKEEAGRRETERECSCHSVTVFPLKFDWRKCSNHFSSSFIDLSNADHDDVLLFHILLFVFFIHISLFIGCRQFRFLLLCCSLPLFALFLFLSSFECHTQGYETFGPCCHDCIAIWSTGSVGFYSRHFIFRNKSVSRGKPYCIPLKCHQLNFVHVILSFKLKISYFLILPLHI